MHRKNDFPAAELKSYEGPGFLKNRKIRLLIELILTVVALYFATLKGLEVQEEVLRSNYNTLGKYIKRKEFQDAEKAQREERHSRKREVKKRDQE